MSVEEKLIRLAPPAFESLQQNPTTLIDLIEEFGNADSFDARGVLNGPVHFHGPTPRMIHIDEFTIWLLTDRHEHNALCDAVVAWRDTQELMGAQHGQGFVYATYQSPEAVRVVARGLQKYPKRELKNGSSSTRTCSGRQPRPISRESKPFLHIKGDSLNFSKGFIARQRDTRSLCCT